MKALHFVNEYLRDRKHRTKISDTYSSWKGNSYVWVRQGSTLGSLLFNIDLCDLFVTIDQHDITNYVDENTTDVSGKNIDEVVKSLEKASHLIFKWFSDNEFQGNASKCHVSLSTGQQVHVHIDTSQIKNIQYEKLEGITTNTKLSFKTIIQQICRKARAKLKVFAGIAPFMNIEKKKLLMNAFFYAQFSYCPLKWMLHSRKVNNKIKRMHEKYLRIVYNDNTSSSYRQLLEIDNSFSVHHRNILILAIELYKIVNGFSSDLMKDVFPLNSNLS